MVRHRRRTLRFSSLSSLVAVVVAGLSGCAASTTAAIEARPSGPICIEGERPRDDSPLPPERPHPECARLSDNFSPWVVQRVVRGHLDCYRRCFEDGNGTSSGESERRVFVKLVIADGDGRVRSAKVESFSAVPERVARCIAEEVGRLEFPPPDCGDLEVEYPFTFVD